MIPPISGTSSVVDESVRLKEAAGQFEALLIAQMLRSAREGSASTEDSDSATMFELSEQHLAQVLTEQGGLGLSKMIVEHLKK